MTPTQRSLKRLRSQGWLAGIVEKWNSHVGIRQDLFGFADIVAVKGDETMWVQCTSGANMSARLKKIGECENAKWILAQSKHQLIAVHGWRKVGARGKRKLWDCREVMVTPVEPADAEWEAKWGSCLVLIDKVCDT